MLLSGLHRSSGDQRGKGRSVSVPAVAGWFVLFQTDMENFLPSPLPTETHTCPVHWYTQTTDTAPEFNWEDP